MGLSLRRGWGTENELHRLRTLYELLAALSRARTASEVYEIALTSLLAATGAERAAILFFDQKDIMQFAASRGLSSEYRQAVTGHTPWAKGDRDTQPIGIEDVLADISLSAFRPLFLREGIRSLVFLPLSGRNGLFGKCMLYFGEPHTLTSEELGFAETIAGHIALAAERQRLDAESSYLAAIVNSSDDAIIGKDLNGIISSWNAGAERLFGYSAAEAVGQPVSMLTVHGREDEISGILESVREGRTVEHYETLTRTKDGRTLHVAETVSPVRDADGRIIGASKIARDITGRKHAEQERTTLLQREQTARTTAELLNRVGPLLLEQRDLERLTQSVTDIASTLVGAEFGAFCHKVMDEQGESYVLHALSGMSREACAETSLNLSLFGGTSPSEGVVRCNDLATEPRYSGTPDGTSQRPLAVRSYLECPIVSQTGEILGGLFFGHSLPGRFTTAHEAILIGIASQAAIAMDNARLFEQASEAQRQLQHSNEELKRANHDLETFVYSASHDLREPLHTIALCAQLLERVQGPKLEGDSATFLLRIRRGVDRLERLLADLLAYATATKRLEGQPPEVSAGTAISEAVEALRGPIDESGGMVTWDPLPTVRIHESRLNQVFQNLLSNALKYRREPPRVHITAKQERGSTVFSISDNGIGIPRQYANQIFGLFKRLHSRDEYPGSGIGLSICQRLLDHYNGRIWLEHSEPGIGSTFCFSIPDPDSDGR